MQKSKLFHDANNDDDAKAIAIPRGFYENSQLKTSLTIFPVSATCSPNFPHIEHGFLGNSTNQLFVNGYTLPVECSPGYEPAFAGSKSGIRCDATSDQWSALSDTKCIAKGNENTQLCRIDMTITLTL